LNPSSVATRRSVLVGGGFVTGLTIGFVDNFAFRGEVNPIMVVAMLLAATVVPGFIFGLRGWVAAATTWVCIPLVHVVKHLLDLPDTMHPNTYVSILVLAAFTFVVSAVGIGCGMFLRVITTEATNQRS
jgi:hypothetical protein